MLTNRRGDSATVAVSSLRHLAIKPETAFGNQRQKKRYRLYW
jgi:hypothetical protein